MIYWTTKKIPSECYNAPTEEIEKMIADANKGGIKKNEAVEYGKVVYYVIDQGYYEVEGTLDYGKCQNTIVVTDLNSVVTIVRAKQIVAIEKVVI